MYNHEKAKKIMELAERALELVMGMKIPSTYSPEERCTVSRINLVWEPAMSVAKTLDPGDDLIISIDDFSLCNEAGMRVATYPAVLIQKSQLSDMSGAIQKIRREAYNLLGHPPIGASGCPCPFVEE